MEALVRRVGEATGFHGFCGFDWVDSDGNAVLIDFHGRPSSGFHLGKRVGVDFAKAVSLLSSRSKPLPVMPPEIGGAKRLFLYPHHFHQSLRSRDWRGLLGWLGIHRQGDDFCRPGVRYVPAFVDLYGRSLKTALLGKLKASSGR